MRRASSASLRTKRGLLTLGLLLQGLAGCVDALGGDFAGGPDTELGAEAQALVAAAYEGLPREELFDHHTHLVGLGAGGTGARVHQRMRSFALHPIAYAKFSVYKSAAGITREEEADAQYVARLLELARATGGRHLLLAFDEAYSPSGERLPEASEFYTPNDYVFQVCARAPDVFVPAISVHPYRPDALAELERGAARGARAVKWLPNAMQIDPADPRLDPYYRKLRELGLVLLSHAGEERAVHAEEAQELGNPLRLRRALDAGVTVMVAHLGSRGTSRDLDDPAGPQVASFELFRRLAAEPRPGQVLGEISALTESSRVPEPLSSLLEDPTLTERVVNGSDYPMPAVNVFVRTGALVEHGFITAAERRALNEIYAVNPLLFDLVVKRTMRSPQSGRRLPARVFRQHPALGY